MKWLPVTTIVSITARDTRPRRAQQGVPRVEDDSDAERQGPAEVEARHGGDRIREALVVRPADVDAGVEVDRVLDPASASRGGAVGKRQWMMSAIAVARRKPSRKIEKPSRSRQ